MIAHLESCNTYAVDTTEYAFERLFPIAPLSSGAFASAGSEGNAFNNPQPGNIDGLTCSSNMLVQGYALG